jgi:hypothetical protein
MLRRCCLTLLALLVFVSASLLPVRGAPSATVARSPLNLELRDHHGGVNNAVFARDTYVYASFGVEFAILDVANPVTPERRGFVLMPDIVTDVTVVGRYAFVTCYNVGMWVVDIGNPDAPTIVGNVALPGVSSRLDVVGNYAYVVADYTYVSSNYYYGGLSLVDVTNPREPLLISRYDRGSGGLAIVGNFLYLTDLFEGLMVLDISNPRSLKLLGTYDLDEYPYDVAVDNQYAYVTTLSG